MNQVKTPLISIDQFVVEFALNFRVVEVYGAHSPGDKFIWFRDVSEPMKQILARACMWGGPDNFRTAEDGVHERRYEFNADRVDWLRELQLMTRGYRNTDNEVIL